MRTADWFRLPQASNVAAYAEAQVRLYKQDPSFQDYFLALELHFKRNSFGSVRPKTFAQSLGELALEGAYDCARSFARRKFKADILLCPMPYFRRRPENQLLIRMVKGLAQTGASIVCLLPQDAPSRQEIEGWLDSESRKSQVTLVDPASLLNRVARRLYARVARKRGSSAFDEIVGILRPVGLAPAQDSRDAFIYTASYAAAWDAVESWFEFEAVVTRCHWQVLCSPVCRTGLKRGKNVISFQQGVIGHTLDVPVSVSKFVTFGESSAALLRRMNRSFFQSVATAEPLVQFYPGGCLIDNVKALPNQFGKRTLLILDEPVGADEIYSIGPEREAVLDLATKLLSSATPPKLIVRPHPDWNTSGLDAWKGLIREFPNFIELSHASWTLEEDLWRSSVALGVFSGALTVASASGLPTFFMSTESGYWTEDLACFARGQRVAPTEAFGAISSVLDDTHAYARAKAVALENARDYYAGGSNLELKPEFFERMLHSKTSTS